MNTQPAMWKSLKLILICFLIFSFTCPLFSQSTSVYGSCIDGPLRIRRAPTTSSDIMGRLENEDSFRVIGRTSYKDRIGEYNNFWYHIEFHEASRGYVYGEFINVEDTYYNNRFLDRNNTVVNIEDLWDFCPRYRIEDSYITYANSQIKRKTSGLFYIINYDKVREDFYVFNTEKEYGIIALNDLKVKDDPSYSGSFENKLRESSNIVNRNIVHRNGPVLDINYKDNVYRYIDEMGRGPYYNLADIIDDRYLLISCAYYESGSYQLLDTVNNSVYENLFYDPVFSSTGDSFFCFGTFQDIGEISVYSANSSDKAQFSYTFRDMPESYGYIVGSRWINNSKIEIEFEKKICSIELIANHWHLIK